jgi:small subunit ribosomal protein S20
VFVARTASAKKQHRQGLKHRARNRRNLSQLKTQVKKLRGALSKPQGQDLKGLLAETVGQIDKAARKGVIHDNAAARYKSRLTKRVNAQAAAKA